MVDQQSLLDPILESVTFLDSTQPTPKVGTDIESPEPSVYVLNLLLHPVAPDLSAPSAATGQTSSQSPPEERRLVNTSRGQSRSRWKRMLSRPALSPSSNYFLVQLCFSVMSCDVLYCLVDILYIYV
jgi:hypothetical protein